MLIFLSHSTGQIAEISIHSAPKLSTFQLNHTYRIYFPMQKQHRTSSNLKSIFLELIALIEVSECRKMKEGIADDSICKYLNEWEEK